MRATQSVRVLRHAVVAIAALSLLEAPAAAQEHDWRSDWAVRESFAVLEDSSGFSIPTAIAVVPEPGDGPKDPLYFVTELRGLVKVVTNDRSIFEFSNVPAFAPATELPAGDAAAGLAGICLDPQQGLVFVTFAGRDAGGLLRNNVIRFETQPRTFAVQPTSARVIAEAISKEQSAVSHQIGGCAVEGDALYISVGDGGDPAASQARDRLLGKVLRPTLDGEPHPDNPFSGPESKGPADGAAYVWALGLRNPFAISVVGGTVVVADNGAAIDRVVRVERGENYLWNGNDWSIGARADAALFPAIGPVHMAVYPSGSPLFPAPYRSHFYIAASGNPEVPAGIVAVPYEPATARVVGTPSYVVEYWGHDFPGVGGVAFGPDGLYFTPLLPGQAGRTPILKLVHDPGGDYPTIIGRGGDLIGAKGCRGCHIVGGQGRTVGPALSFEDPLVRMKLEEKLGSEVYRARLVALDALEEEPYPSTRGARKQVLDSQGVDRLEAYVRNKLLQPKFDDPGASMPNLGISEEEATQIAVILLSSVGAGASPLKRAARRIRALFPFPEGRAGDMLTGATLGLVTGLAVAAAFGLGFVRLARSRSRAARR
jgi:glucose/arabinose dehydrogenase